MDTFTIVNIDGAGDYFRRSTNGKYCEKTPSSRRESSYLKAGLEAGAKAEAEANEAAMQKKVFMVDKATNWSIVRREDAALRFRH